MSWRQSVSLVAALALGALAATPASSDPLCPSEAGLKGLRDGIFGNPAQQGPDKIGDEISLKVRNKDTAPRKSGGEAEMVWTEKIHYPGASYIAPHFSRFNLPGGASLIVRSPDGKRSWKFAGTGKGELGVTEGFWGIHIPGDTAVLEMWSSHPVPAGAVELDRFAAGYADALALGEPSTEAICGVDDSQWAKCLQSTEPSIYDKSRAVARLIINGSGGCTGWLVGDSGHLMTNEHCITSASDAANTDYEFMAEGATCTTSCATFGGCPGTVVATSATFIQNDAILDYTLVQLPTNPTGTYGFLQLRSSGAVVDERIYIPGHPAAYGKKIADNSTHASDASGKCEVYSLTEPPCSGGSGNDVGYMCDTQGGSSGSPVLGYNDHLVVSLHHCATCPNRGLPIQAIISDLGSNLPPNAIGGSTCTPPAAPTGLTATAAGPTQINLSWSAVSGATQYRIYRSATSGGPYTQVGTATGTTFADTAVSCNTAYYYVVRAYAGCESASSAQASATTAGCPSCVNTTLYTSGFETGTGLGGWTRGTFLSGGATASWRGIQTCTARTGTKIFRFGGTSCTADYTNTNFNYVHPPAITVPAGTTVSRLSFWHRRRFESGYDGGTLRVSVDGGAWANVPATAILSGTSYNGTISASCAPSGAAGLPAFTGVAATFANTTVNLDAACITAGFPGGCAGHSVRIGFTAITDGSVVDDGWFLDDVSVTACVP